MVARPWNTPAVSLYLSGGRFSKSPVQRTDGGRGAASTISLHGMNPERILIAPPKEGPSAPLSGGAPSQSAATALCERSRVVFRAPSIGARTGHLRPSPPAFAPVPGLGGTLEAAWLMLDMSRVAYDKKGLPCGFAA